MTMSILRDVANRAEYKRRWQIMTNAGRRGFDVALVDAFYAKMAAKGYKHETIFSALCYAAREGVFGQIQKGARE